MSSPVLTYPALNQAAAHRWQRWVPLILIVLLAVLLRVYQLDIIPPGLHYDEAFNAIQARNVLRGTDRPIFFVGNFGEEPMQMYLAAFVFGAVGESAWAIRLTSAILGILLIPALYLCARVFFPRSERVALFAALFAACLYWAINFSRIGIETNALPVILTLSAATLGLAYRTKKWKWVISAGILLGATIYTYLASRAWFLAVGIWIIYLIIFHRQVIRENINKWMILFLVTALAIAPLLVFFALNPLALSGRAAQVLTFESIGNNLLRTLGMFFVSGDLDPRDNLPGRPALDLVLALFFLVGLVFAAKRFRQPFYAFLLIWVVTMTLPSALTEFAPNFRRAIGAMPALIILCSLGLNWLFENPKGYWRWAVTAALVIGVAYSAAKSVYDYFEVWAKDPGLYYSFDAGVLRTAQALAAQPPAEQLYLSPDYHEHPTVLWALDGRPFSSYDGRQGQVLPNSGRAATYGIISHEDELSPAFLAKALNSNELSDAINDSSGNLYAQLFHLEPGDGLPRPPGQFLNERLDNFATLVGADLPGNVAQSGNPIGLTLYWTVQAPAPEDFTVFVHLTGPLNPATGTTVWAQADSQPVGATYPTTRWRAGEEILDPFSLKVPPEAPPGEYKIVAGMYNLATGARVPLYDEKGNRAPDDSYTLESISVK